MPGKGKWIFLLILVLAAAGVIFWRLIAHNPETAGSGEAPCGKSVTRYTDQPAAPSGSGPVFHPDNKSSLRIEEALKPGIAERPEEEEESLPPAPPPEPDELDVDFYKSPSETFQMNFIKIPDGTFTFGDPAGQSDEKPPVDIELDTFYISRAPVSIKDYRAYIALIKGQVLPTLPSSYSRDESNPIVNVSWGEAQDYCRWIGERVNEFLGRERFQGSLPAETQWEKAARLNIRDIFSSLAAPKEEWTASGFLEDIHERIEKLGDRIEIPPPGEGTANLAAVRDGGRTRPFSRKSEAIRMRNEKTSFRVVLNKINP